MALLNKLFPSRKSHVKNRHQENVSNKLFTFTEEQVQIILFRECDFRGRKLLFDSKAVKKVSFSNKEKIENFRKPPEAFEYTYTKPEEGFTELAEMVFGSVAMSFRGTYFKIHTLSSPKRLMFTQVFCGPYPRRKQINRGSESAPLSTNSNIMDSNQSFEHSFKFDDSGESSVNSLSEQLSVRSTTSDTILVYKNRGSNCIPKYIEVSSHSSVIRDSGYSDYSFSSVQSESCSFQTQSLIFPHTGFLFSSGSLLHKIMRSTSTSLDNSSSGSTDEWFPKGNFKNNKLGLAIIIQLTEGYEEKLTQFIMQHIAQFESMLWRARQAVVNIPYSRPSSFISSMMEIYNTSTQWMINLLSGPLLTKNQWQLLSSTCDSNHNSISDQLRNGFKNELPRSSSFSFLELEKVMGKNQLTSSLKSFPVLNLDKNNDFLSFLKLTNFLKTEKCSFPKNQSCYIEEEKFLRDFCEILEEVDIKDTNFFISTLITAVLTHHLGWVATCLPQSSLDKRNLQEKQTSPYNPLWGQLSDLYGAVGYPLKMAQTIITGTNKNELILKILNTLTYFIRFCEVDRHLMTRSNIEEDYKQINEILNEKNCKEKDSTKAIEKIGSFEDKPFINTKEYEDIELKTFSQNSVMKPVQLINKAKKIVKTKTFSSNLADFEEEDKSKCDMFSKLNADLDDSSCIKSNCSDGGQKVVFVLGEDEKLIGLKCDKIKEDKIVTSKESLINDTGIFKESDFIKLNEEVKPSNSYLSLKSLEKNVLDNISIESASASRVPSVLKDKTNRAQSEPPEMKKAEVEMKKAGPRYKYNGVKFNLQQYPQIVTNYMKSKNLEISNLPLGDKSKFNTLPSVSNLKFDFSEYESDNEEIEALQTPSNASELEFTSDLLLDPSKDRNKAEQPKLVYNENQSASNLSKENNKTEKKICQTTDAPLYNSMKMKIIDLPMPKSVPSCDLNLYVPYASSIMRGIVENYAPDMILQGVACPKTQWECKLKSDLILSCQRSLLDETVDEAVAIIGNLDTWDVQLMSSHTFVIDKNSTGTRVGMSQMVANMLESLLHLWKLQVPPKYCLMHIEQKLQELCVRSKALAQLLLGTEFCNMELLTSTLQLEVNDIPLLMAVASTHSPQVTKKYGLSFQ